MAAAQLLIAVCWLSLFFNPNSYSQPLMKQMLVVLFVCSITVASAGFLSLHNNTLSRTPGSAHAAVKEKLINSALVLKELLHTDSSSSAVLAYTNGMRPVAVYYFKGTGNQNALVIGGVHGSELSSVEVAAEVIRQLQNGPKPFYNVIVIPSLFPDNKAVAESVPGEIGSLQNIGRYTSEMTADPNRQMPALGHAFTSDSPTDIAGRYIEMENQLLLQLIQLYKPERIASLHAIRNEELAGVYADPRTDCNSLALGFEKDSSLAVQMATYIEENGGIAPGNKAGGHKTALYYCDPAIAARGEKQTRNMHGSRLPQNKGYGVSLGSWASTGVCGEKDNDSRSASVLLTIEFPGNKRSQDYAGFKKATCLKYIEAYAASITRVFLQSSTIANNISG